MSPNGSDRSPRRPTRRKLLQALTAGLVLATATGCTWEDFPRLGMPTPTSEGAEVVLSLWQGSWAAALAIGALVWGLILWSAFFHRRSRTKVEVPPQTRYNMPIEALYTVVPLIIVSVFFYFTARDESELMKLDPKPDVTVNVVGFQWSWCFNYIENVEGSTGDAKTDKALEAVPDLYKKAFPADAGGVNDCGTPSTRNPQTNNPGPTLWLPEGKRVRFVLTSRDVIHSFWVVPFLMKQDVIPGHPNAFEVVPNREGTFLGKCAELCGVDHARMLFNVKVVSPERYEQHLKELAEKGQTGYVPAGIDQTSHEKNREANIL
ncbi:cytochrome c oxidase subunit II [Streptomyces sp. NPDC005774]|uniref:aa3-type cytochrome oxidase subunit II n=1 Tax=Streptomyces sp. NPDC005774 TaxID=3364728 RepID=UPI0036AFF396